MDVKVDLNTKRLNQRFGASAIGQAQKILDTQVLKDCEPYVPMQSGALKDSGITGTTIGSGTIKYQSKYAAAQYYGMPNKSTNAHPMAIMRWFEACKAVRKAAWLRVVKKAGW